MILILMFFQIYNIILYFKRIVYQNFTHRNHPTPRHIAAVASQGALFFLIKIDIIHINKAVYTQKMPLEGLRINTC